MDEASKTNLGESSAPTKDNHLTLAQLGTTAGMSVLGLIAARLLGLDGLVTLQVSREGNIEVVPIGEIELDVHAEDVALGALIDRGYTDTQLAEYMRQREDRLARRPQFPR